MASRRRPPAFKLTPPPPPKERAIQRAVLDVFRRFYPEGVIFHIPNGGGRSKVEAAILKGDGVLSGVPDLCVVRPNKRTGWIEVKRPHIGNLSENQRDLADDFLDRGHLVYLIDDADKAYKLVQLWKKEDAGGK